LIWFPHFCPCTDFNNSHTLEKGILHRRKGNPLHNYIQATVVIPTSHKRFIPEYGLARPCHVCSGAVGMVTGRSASRAIRDRVVVRRRRKI